MSEQVKRLGGTCVGGGSHPWRFTRSARRHGAVPDLRSLVDHWHGGSAHLQRLGFQRALPARQHRAGGAWPVECQRLAVQVACQPALPDRWTRLSMKRRRFQDGAGRYHCLKCASTGAGRVRKYAAAGTGGCPSARIGIDAPSWQSVFSPRQKPVAMYYRHGAVEILSTTTTCAGITWKNASNMRSPIRGSRCHPGRPLRLGSAAGTAPWTIPHHRPSAFCPQRAASMARRSSCWRCRPDLEARIARALPSAAAMRLNRSSMACGRWRLDGRRPPRGVMLPWSPHGGDGWPVGVRRDRADDMRCDSRWSASSASRRGPLYGDRNPPFIGAVAA